MSNHTQARPGTLSVWAGEEKKSWWGATQLPVVHSVAFGYADVDEWQAAALGRQPGHIYSRNSNPTVAAFEDKVRLLEKAEAATSFATGMAAISNILFTLLKPGDRLVSVKDSYGGTNKLFLEFLPRFQIQVKLCNTTDHEAIEAEIAKGCRVLYLETPTNPTLKVMDIKRLTRAAHKVGATVVADNTFATPINQSPLALGVDLVLHSATKFLGGHGDVVAGVVCCDEGHAKALRQVRAATGGLLHPLAAFLLHRGLPTLALRVERAQANAIELAGRLTAHPAVAKVFFPGLGTVRNAHLHTTQMHGPGTLIAFEMHGGHDAAAVVMRHVALLTPAVSLGSVDTLIQHPAGLTHRVLDEATRERCGITAGLLRLSVGIEHVDDLWADLAQALHRAHAMPLRDAA